VPGRWRGWLRRWTVLVVGGWTVLAVAAVPARDCPPPPEPFTATELQAAEQAPQDHGLLWRIEKEGRVSHLYGTVHLARRVWAQPGPRVRAALQQADRAVFELNLLDAQVLERLQRAARSRPGDPRLPPADLRRMAEVARRLCATGSLDGLRPELQVVTLVSLVLRRDGLDPAWGLDGVLMRRAQAQGLPIESLETPEQQMALLVHDDPQQMRRAVRQGLQELESTSARAVVRRLVRAWSEGRLDDLERFPEWCGCQDTAADRAQHHASVEARNPAMADRIAALHGRGLSVFAAVGVLHMVGQEGLPQQMARRGFRVDLVLAHASPDRP
jgi:uncharacterized protein